MEEKRLKASQASALITQNSVKLAPGTKVLDLACGSGRNGLWFEQQGCHVTYMDRNLDGLLEQKQSNAGTQFELVAIDLEDGNANKLPTATFDIVLVFNYLHRPILDDIANSLKPGGTLYYETFISQQAEVGRPKNPNYLLNPLELQNRFAQWHAFHYFEGNVGTQLIPCYKAQLITKKPTI